MPKSWHVKCCPIRLRTSEKIELTDETQKVRCENASNFLRLSQESSYSHFVHLTKKTSTYLNQFNYRETQGIECAIWPNLYLFTKWCECNISGGHTHLSSKVSFHSKLVSGVLHYAMHVDLLQFQYDCWLYKTVSGAINTACFLKCSPACVLDTKTFLATYWQWQRRYVLDAVAQFGLPDVFVTISPFEWSFPFPQRLHDVRENTGKNPTELAGYETAHIVHVLAQMVRGLPMRK